MLRETSSRSATVASDLFEPGISVIVPVFNSAGSLEPLAARLNSVLQTLAPAFEIIFVNDGSRDNSWAVISALALQNKYIRGLNLMRNYGQHNALLCGIRLARYEVTVTIDDDLQNPPEELPAMLAKLEQGFDVVYGKPRAEQHQFWRTIASQITKIVLQETMNAETARSISAFRIFYTVQRRAFSQYQGPYVSIDVLLTWSTSRFAAIEVQHDPRQTGPSNYTLKTLVLHALNMMTGFSTWPLRLASITGFSFTLVGLLTLAYVVVRYLIQGGSVPGFPFLASTLAMFSGAQLFALGIIGEYLARIHFRLMDRPTYVVRESAGHDEGKIGGTST